MRVSGRVLAVMLFLFIVAELVILTPRTESTRDDLPQVSSQAETVEEQWMVGAQVIETQDGQKKWELRAREATGVKSLETWKLRNLEAVFFDEESRERFRMKGDEGRVDGKSKNMKVFGNVILDSVNGYRLETTKADYNSEDGTLLGEDPLTMKARDQKSLEIRGIGFRGTIKGGHVDILKDVNVRRLLADGRTLIIRSRQARFNGKDHSANFSGEVVLDFGSSRVQGPEARFEYNPKTDEVEVVEVEGGVRLVDIDKWATSHRFRMNLKTGAFSLKGSPRLVQEKDELRGEEILFFDGGKRIQVRGAKADLDSSKDGNGL